MKEDAIEKYLDDEVTALGGFTIKLNPKGYKGLQDRLVVLPQAIIIAELKRPRGGVTAELQHWWKNRFRHLGHHAVIVRTKDEVDDLLTAYRAQR